MAIHERAQSRNWSHHVFLPTGEQLVCLPELEAS